MSKLEKKKEVVLSKAQAAVVVDALMLCYGLIIDQIPLEDLIAEVDRRRQEITDSFKKSSDGK